MSPRRRSPHLAARQALLAGAALAALSLATAHAQGSVDPTQTATTPGRDGLVQGELYMEADEVLREDKTGVTTATGNVEIRYNGRTLRADRLVYDDKTGVIRALGHVQIIAADGTAEFAEQAVLDEDMRAGVAVGFSARLQENIKIAAASASKRNEFVEELDRAIYTPCEICKQDGSDKQPTWSIAADRVVRDKKRRLVYYKNARFRILNTPVLYLPVFWHADPQADRASGFLVPKASASDRRGFSYEQPYYWAISPSMDLTISPQINTKVNPFLNTQFRKAFYSGVIDIRAGYTHERDFDGKGNEFGDNTDRSYILGRGAFQLNEKWRWGFTAERTSDDYIFDKYEISHVYESRGPYVADDRRLISQLYTTRQDARSYVSVAGMTIQGLRPGDVDRTFPIIGPLIESHYDAPGQVLGGRVRASLSGAVLSREQAVFDYALRVPGLTSANIASELPGLDSRRITGEVQWTRAFTSQAGVRVEPFLWVRADAYNLHDILTGVGSATKNRSLTRGMAMAGAEVTYPFFKRIKDATLIVEPVAQAVYSPDTKQIVLGYDKTTGLPIYMNEDSIAFEFDETTLFRPNKFPGYDLFEEGLRLNVAGRAAIHWDDGRRANLLIGRSFRDQRNPVFLNPTGVDRTGLATKNSDWIVAADAEPMRGLGMFVRARFDNDDFAVHRLEAGANVANKYGNGFIRYLTDDFDINSQPITIPPTTPIGLASLKRENLDVGGEVYLGKNFGVSAYGNRDLARDAWVVRDLGAFYRDDCIRVDVIYRREDVITGRLRPSNSVTVRLTLATLGGTFNGR